ncbi:hypothetical protein bcgnr5378_07060 [Bacillus cereus]|uniref:Uncharacterized protein n=1 Tax=Bacillus cereus TaxID=1396 RepID=A0A164NXA5_BACCE|nr:hypothetical protein [Bacillus cereus]KZD65962.1 hypothetical protein B4088_2719 [Bacillus cereus]
MAIIVFDPKEIETASNFTLVFTADGNSTKFSINKSFKELMEKEHLYHILPKYDDEAEILTLTLNKDKGIEFRNKAGEPKHQINATEVFNAMCSIMHIEHGNKLTFQRNENEFSCYVQKRVKK